MQRRSYQQRALRLIDLDSLVPEPAIQEGQNSFKSLAMSTGPEKCFFTSSVQVE
jgi:hypothetical protein